jgi:hypothetical protein
MTRPITSYTRSGNISRRHWKITSCCTSYTAGRCAERLLCISGDPCSNPGRETGQAKIFCALPQSLWANAELAP